MLKPAGYKGWLVFENAHTSRLLKLAIVHREMRRWKYNKGDQKTDSWRMTMRLVRLKSDWVGSTKGKPISSPSWLLRWKPAMDVTADVEEEKKAERLNRTGQVLDAWTTLHTLYSMH